MLSERLKERLKKDRPMTTITLRIPIDVVRSLKGIAPLKGYAGYQTLLKSYISEGLRRDEALVSADAVAKLTAALRKYGVSQATIEKAKKELTDRNEDS